jgi:HPt (histidine-containing phosphotransfer) domain-containing protein
MNKQPDSPINLSYLNEISEGNIEFEIELFQVYFEDVSPRIQKIREAIANNDWAMIMSQVHQVKGASGNVGAFQMEMLAVRLEKLDRDRSSETALAIVDEMFIGVKAVEGFVAKKVADFSS